MAALLGYLAACILVLGITGVSGRRGLLQMATVLGADCATTLTIASGLGVSAAFMVEPIQHLVFARMLLASRRVRAEECSWFVIGAYGAGLALDLAHAAGWLPTSSYTLATNVVFIGQLVVVGVAGGPDAFRNVVGALGGWLSDRLRDRSRQAPVFRTRR